MRVGITGHQEREGIKWPWVADAIRRELARVENVQKALSSLAAGSDQVFAEVALGLGIQLVAVVPLDRYERFFQKGSLANYQRLLDASEVVQLGWRGEPELAFFEAGKFIVENCDELFAVWDGQSAEGLGGTGDVVTYAQRVGRPILHINPCTETVARI